MTTPTWHHHRRPHPQRGAVARGALVGTGLVAGLAAAIGLQVAGPQVQDRVVAWLGAVPGVRIAMRCPGDAARSASMHAAPKAHAIAASNGLGVMPAI